MFENLGAVEPYQTPQWHARYLALTGPLAHGRGLDFQSQRERLSGV